MLSGPTGPEKVMIEKDDDVSRDLLAAPPRVVNIGLEIFAANLAGQDAQVAHVRWSPPAGGNSHLAGLLEKLQGR
jgi:FdrA protein